MKKYAQWAAHNTELAIIIALYYTVAFAQWIPHRFEKNKNKNKHRELLGYTLWLKLHRNHQLISKCFVWTINCIMKIYLIYLIFCSSLQEFILNFGGITRGGSIAENWTYFFLGHWSYNHFGGLDLSQKKNVRLLPSLTAARAQCCGKRTAKKSDGLMPLTQTALGRLSFSLN